MLTPDPLNIFIRAPSAHFQVGALLKPALLHLLDCRGVLKDLLSLLIVGISLRVGALLSLLTVGLLLTDFLSLLNDLLTVSVRQSQLKDEGNAEHRRPDGSSPHAYAQAEVQELQPTAPHRSRARV